MLPQAALAATSAASATANVGRLRVLLQLSRFTPFRPSLPTSTLLAHQLFSTITNLDTIRSSHDVPPSPQTPHLGPTSPPTHITPPARHLHAAQYAGHAAPSSSSSSPRCPQPSCLHHPLQFRQQLGHHPWLLQNHTEWLQRQQQQQGVTSTSVHWPSSMCGYSTSTWSTAGGGASGGAAFVPIHPTLVGARSKGSSGGSSGVFDEEERALMTPSVIVGLLDRYIIGQHDAKRAVATALRNRWRRRRLPSPMKEEVMPKNILMIGPTGCGKTEIARRLAKIADAPFIKVEATKYTELGYVGRDVDDIIKDLVESAISLVRTRLRQRLLAQTQRKVEDVVIESLLGEHADPAMIETFRKEYRAGNLDERTIEVELPSPDVSRLGWDRGALAVDKLFAQTPSLGTRRPDKKKMKVGDAKQHIAEMEVERFLSSELVNREAVRAAQEDGIVFIDEIDKVVDSSTGMRGGGMRGSVSSEGVQRDLLPIIEGSTVNTKYGNVSTDHILFICSGAFHSSKPADMLAELQGRLPIRVELRGLTAEDFLRILTEPHNNMIRQHQALLRTEGIDLSFTPEALKETARLAEEANRLLDNIGARRLHTVLERILAEVSYDATTIADAARREGQANCQFEVDKAYVTQRMGDLLKKPDLSRYIL